MAATAETEGQTLVQRSVEQWESRLEELRPAVAEAKEIEKALEGVRSTTRQNRGGRPRGSGSGGNGRGRRNGGRRDEFVKLVRDNPGITVSDAAKKLGVNPNYLYRVAGQATDAGEVVKDGQGYKVAQGGGDEGGGDN